MGVIRGEPVPYGTDDRGRASAKALTMVTKLMRHFGGEPVPYGTDDRGRAGAKSLTVGTKLMGVFKCLQNILSDHRREN